MLDARLLAKVFSMNEINMYEELQDLLSELCVEKGFCLSTPFWEAIASTKHYSAKQFVESIFIADCTVLSDRKCFESIIRDMFVSKFGEEIHFWNRRFEVLKRKRITLIEKNEIILLEYARDEKSRKFRKPRERKLRAKFKGFTLLKAAKRKLI